MKKTLLFIGLFLISFCAISQNKKENRKEKIKALKVAFITEELNLTPSEAEKFWPIYNYYDKKIHNLDRTEKHKIIVQIKESKGAENISENDAKIILDKLDKIESESFQLKKEFTTKLKSVISSQKILTLKIAEKDFIRKLMREYRKEKRNKFKKDKK